MELTCETVKAYQNGMDGVDHSNQSRERGNGFASKAHNKKWYTKACFAIINFMTLNAFFAWNMLVPKVECCFTLKRSEFYEAFPEELITFVGVFDVENPAKQTSNPLMLYIDGHSPMTVNH